MSGAKYSPDNLYALWLEKHRPDLERIKAEIPNLNYKPLFSVIVPVYNPEERWLRRCIESVLNQLYPYWELCLADDASTQPQVRSIIEEYLNRQMRWPAARRFRQSQIKAVFRGSRGHISAASNSALKLATGEFIALLDHDDELSPDALYENAKLLNRHPEADVIYSDEDHIDENGRRHSPFFKPDWSPDLLLSQMYTCHLGVYRTTLVREIGGFRPGFEGAQDWDLMLRLTERTDRIYHIPKILYHWRNTEKSTAFSIDSKPYARQAALTALKEAMARRGENAAVEEVTGAPVHFRVHYLLARRPLISIVIPTRDRPELLAPCLESVFSRSTYANFEVILVDNGSREETTRQLLAQNSEGVPQRKKNRNTLCREGKASIFASLWH